MLITDNANNLVPSASISRPAVYAIKTTPDNVLTILSQKEWSLTTPVHLHSARADNTNAVMATSPSVYTPPFK